MTNVTHEIGKVTINVKMLVRSKMVVMLKILIASEARFREESGDGRAARGNIVHNRFVQFGQPPKSFPGTSTTIFMPSRVSWDLHFRVFHQKGAKPIWSHRYT